MSCTLITYVAPTCQFHTTSDFMTFDFIEELT